ncbi:hypothetical protein D3C78_1630070 [compost metagenome]
MHITDQLQGPEAFTGVLNQIIEAFLYLGQCQRTDVFHAPFVQLLGGETFIGRRAAVAKQVVGRTAHHQQGHTQYRQQSQTRLGKGHGGFGRQRGWGRQAANHMALRAANRMEGPVLLLRHADTRDQTQIPTRASY